MRDMTIKNSAPNKNGYDSYRMATARFVVQVNQANTDDVSLTEFDLLDMSKVWGLRPLSPVTVRTNKQLAEFAVEVEYGPALGPLDNKLASALKELVSHRAGVRAKEVFAFQQRDATRNELQAELDRLETAADDLDVPLARRRELSDDAFELRRRTGVARKQEMLDGALELRRWIEREAEAEAEAVGGQEDARGCAETNAGPVGQG